MIGLGAQAFRRRDPVFADVRLRRHAAHRGTARFPTTDAEANGNCEVAYE